MTSNTPKIFGPAGQIGDNKGGRREGGGKARISADNLRKYIEHEMNKISDL